MNKVGHTAPLTDIPTQSDADHLVNEASRLFGRTLASWTSDLLELRRVGLLENRWRDEDRQPDTWRMAA